MTDEPVKRGRPSLYTPELAAEICARLADGHTLREIGRDENMPDERTIRDWANANYEGFSPHYDAARLKGYQKMAEELIEIADDGKNDWLERQNKDGSTYLAPNTEHVQRSRLRVDTRKWLLSKALPKIYGDKLDVQHGGSLVIEVVKFTDPQPDKPSDGD